MKTPIIVFAKAPVPGEVKTRLIPVLGAAGAARLHERLVRHALAAAREAAVGPVELCCAPDASHAFFATCGVPLTGQGDGDLGTRMERALARRAPALLIGADCPALTASHLRDAANALAAGYDAALGPAEDGGYVLIGLAARAGATSERLFEPMQWGTPGVLPETRRRLAALGWRTFELPALWDVDRPEDLPRLPQELAEARVLLTPAGCALQAPIGK